MWILSRLPLISTYNMDLAVRALSQIGVASTKLVKDDLSNCEPMGYDTVAVEPLTFRTPINTHKRFNEKPVFRVENDD